MTMKLTQLTTYLDASDANTVIEFLDELRAVLLATYGDEIIEMRLGASENFPRDDDLLGPEFDDEPPF